MMRRHLTVVVVITFLTIAVSARAQEDRVTVAVDEPVILRVC